MFAELTLNTGTEFGYGNALLVRKKRVELRNEGANVEDWVSLTISELIEQCDCVPPSIDAEFGNDVAHMRMHGARTQKELIRYLLVGHAKRQNAVDLGLFTRKLITLGKSFDVVRNDLKLTLE